MKKEYEKRKSTVKKEKKQIVEKKAGKSEFSWKWIHFAPMILLMLLACVDILRFAILGDKTAFITFSLIAAIFILLAYTAWKSRIPFFYLVIAVVTFVLYFNTNFSTSTYYFNWLFLVEAIVAAIGGILRLAAKIRGKIAAEKALAGDVYFPAMVAVVILAGFLGFWKVRSEAAHNAQGQARDELWAVPAKYDETEPEQAGTVEEVIYDTKAYATDERSVKKTAYVYIPYGYDSEKEYNILYLMHGTGDDEKYWLKTNPYNKTMLDNMIADGDIQPLIVVTPTFYVEDDCADDLDQLTYSFAKELRNDLMPEIESSYSTYAKTADDKGFSESRDHRAFAGLSRGAVTTYHSAICQSLDYFSWFGTFSGSRTDAQQFQDTIQSGTFADLPIHYLYVASGNFDFALPGQVQDYQALLDIEPRLRAGVNTCFDVFPMRYHSMGNWHLALYNYLQKIF